jgi:hypothetical protein
LCPAAADCPLIQRNCQLQLPPTISNLSSRLLLFISHLDFSLSCTTLKSKFILQYKHIWLLVIKTAIVFLQLSPLHCLPAFLPACLPACLLDCLPVILFFLGTARGLKNVAFENDSHLFAHHSSVDASILFLISFIVLFFFLLF